MVSTRCAGADDIDGMISPVGVECESPPPDGGLHYLDGDRDTYIPKATADRFSGEVHHCAELGHWAMLEEPQQLASHLAAFSRR